MFFSNAAPLPHFLAQSVQQRPMTLPLWRTVTLVSTLWSVITGHILLTGFFSWRPAAARARVKRAARAAIERCFMSRSFLGSPSNTPHPRSAFLVSWNGMCDTPAREGPVHHAEKGRAEHQVAPSAVRAPSRESGRHRRGRRDAGGHRGAPLPGEAGERVRRHRPPE